MGMLSDKVSQGREHPNWSEKIVSWCPSGKGKGDVLKGNSMCKNVDSESPLWVAGETAGQVEFSSYLDGQKEAVGTIFKKKSGDRRFVERIRAMV